MQSSTAAQLSKQSQFVSSLLGQVFTACHHQKLFICKSAGFPSYICRIPDEESIDDNFGIDLSNCAADQHLFFAT